LHVRPERLVEYVEAHQGVWASMLAALTRSGWRNYSLFVRASDGLVVGYYESDDAAAAMSAQAREEIDAVWQESMAPFFEPGSRLEPLEQYFYLP
jgi:L-rhamnose mutarotase